MKNAIDHISASTLYAGSNGILEINDNAFADVFVYFVHYPLNFPFQFGNSFVVCSHKLVVLYILIKKKSQGVRFHDLESHSWSQP